MKKRTMAIMALSCLVLSFIVSIGATFSAYKVAKEKVVVESVKIYASDGIRVVGKDGKAITNLDIKSSSVGVRPATGEEDSSTSIPTTVNDSVGTEGAYAWFSLTSPSAYKICLKSCWFENGYEDNIENVRIAIMEKENKPVNGSNIGSVLATGEAVTDEEVVVVIWLDKDTTKTIAGSKIKIEIEVQYQ